MDIKKYLLLVIFFAAINNKVVFGQTQYKTSRTALLKQNQKFWNRGGYFYGRSIDEELIEYRTRSSKTFQNKDGTKTVFLGGLTHYKDDSGRWQEIDYSITENNSGKNNTYKYSNISSEIKSYFSGTAGKGVLMNHNGSELSFGIDSKIKVVENGNITYSENASSASASIFDNELIYGSIYQGMDEEYIVLENGQGIENNIIIKNLNSSLKVNGTNSYLEVTQFIPLTAQWKIYNDSIEKNEDFTANIFSLKNNITHEEFFFNPIIVFDNNVTSQDEAQLLLNASDQRLTAEQKETIKNIIKGSYRIHFVNGGIELSYIINAGWLSDNTRKFPITIDPTITIGSASTAVLTLWNGYYADTRTQTLYLASELTAAGMSNSDLITAIGLNHAYSSGDCTGSHTGLKIRMKNTSSSSFSSGSFSNTGYTNVYSGTQNVTSTTGWYTHTFSTNYTFNSSQNLIIDFTMNRSSYLCAASNAAWYYWSTGANRRIYNVSDFDMGDPQIDWSSGTLMTSAPYIQFTYSSGAAPANDDCADAIEIDPNPSCIYTSFSTTNATQSLTGCSGNADDDVWYKFTAIATTATVTVPSSASDDGAFQLRSGACNGTAVTATGGSAGAVSCIDAGAAGSTEYAYYSGLTVGSNYYIRVWDYNAGAGTFSICVTQPCNDPTSSASSITFSSVGCTQMTVGWTNGNGTNRLVIARATSSVTATPSDGNTYTADPSFGTGDAVSSGQYVVYNGSATSVTVTDLSPGTTYYFKVFEYNCDGGNENYKTSSPPSNSRATSSLPSAAGSISGTASVSYGQTAVSYSVAAISGATSYAWSYTGSGYTCASNCTTNSITADFSCSATSGNITVAGVNTCGNGTSSSYTVTLIPPTTAASSITFSSVGCTQMTVGWTNGNGSKRIAVIKSGSAVSGTPTNNTTYTASTAYAAGSTIATGEYVIYDGTSNSVTVTGLTAGTTYYIKVFEYTCSAGYEKYKTASSPSNSQATTALPSASGTISGTAAVTQGSTAVTYSVSAIAGATSYVWTYSGSGYTCASNCTTNSTTADFSCSATSGNLTVYGTNTCGNGTASANYAITTSAPSAAAGGSDQYICTSATTVTMAASGTGTWSKISGPAATITTSTSPTTSITLTGGSGTYVFRWTGSNTCSYDDVMVLKQ